MTYVELMRNLNKTNSLLTKKRFLSTFPNKELLKKILKYTYCPSLVYGVRPKYRTTKYPLMDTFPEELEHLLIKLSKREITGGDAEQAVVNATARYGAIVCHILDRDLDVGIGRNTIEAIFPGLLSMFNVQLAKDARKTKIIYPVIVQEKLDGVRLVSIVDNGHVVFFTRNGKSPHLPKLAEEIGKFPDGIYDGELVKGEGKLKDRTTISGIVTSALAGTSVNLDGIQYALFDYLSRADWTLKYSDNYTIRRNTLLAKYKPSHMISLVNEFYATTKQDIDEFYSYVVERGGEGVILKSPSGRYEYKRSSNWLKLKEELTADLECVGIENGKVWTKYEGEIGALICEGTVGKDFVRVKVGSGLTDYDRARNEGAYLGKVIEVKYNSVVECEGQKSLFLPRFIRVREDR